MIDLSERLRETDERNQTQAHCLAARDKIIGTLETEVRRLNEALEYEQTNHAEAMAEVERLNSCLQYEQHRTGRQGTHADGCYKWGPEHWECAVNEIGRLSEQIKIMLDPENLPYQWCPVDSCFVVQELKKQNTTFCKDCPQFEDD